LYSLGMVVSAAGQGERITGKATQQPFDLSVQVEQNQTEQLDTESASGGDKESTFISSLKDKRDLKSTLKYAISQGETLQANFSLTNTEKTALSISIQSVNLGEIIHLPSEEIYIESGETKNILFTLKADENLPARAYIGNILVKEQEENYGEIDVAVDVNSKQAPVDMIIDIPSDQIALGEELVVFINLKNKSDVKNVEMTLEYTLKDSENRNIAREQEVYLIETQNNITKTFKLPSHVAAGNYLLNVQAIYRSQITSSSHWFRLKEGYVQHYASLFITLIGLIVFACAFHQLRQTQTIKQKVPKNRR
jgi:hypothetical protein